jgi:hypothetical protein
VQWAKGQSGNPGGRPAVVAEVKRLARMHTGEAIDRLVELMRCEDHRVAFAAVRELLDRGYGRAPVTLAEEQPIAGPVILVTGIIRAGDRPVTLEGEAAEIDPDELDPGQQDDQQDEPEA